MKTKSRFWKVFAIVTAALLLCIFAFFAFFYDYIKNYELSQPISGAEAFVKSLTSDDISDAIAEVAARGELTHETPEDVIHSLSSRITGVENLTCRKDFEASTSENPAFIVCSGDIPVYRITLEEGDGARYGFTSWEIAHSEVILSALDFAKTSNVYVPETASLFVNGVEITADSEGKSPYKYTSKWEAENPLTAERYIVSTLTDSTITCKISDIDCEMTTEGDDIYFLYPYSFLDDYVIEAPSSAKVLVNGIPLTADEIMGEPIPYELSPFDGAREDAPTKTLYKISGLEKAPVITATMDDEPLTLWRDDNIFYINYPSEKLYSCEIMAPSGSTVTLNGIELTEEYIKFTEYESKELFSYTTAPAYDVYMVDSLFFAPEYVEISYNGTTLDIPADVDGNTYSYSALYPEVDDSRAIDVTLDFLKAYFYYTSQGYLNTHENLLTVLAFIPEGTPLYTKMILSESGFSFTSPVASMKYNALDVKSTRSYPEGLILTTTKFDLSQSFWGAEGREYRGNIMILLTADYRVVGLEISAEK